MEFDSPHAPATWYADPKTKQFLLMELCQFLLIEVCQKLADQVRTVDQFREQLNQTLVVQEANQQTVTLNIMLQLMKESKEYDPQ